jgi:Domain of unknown function (DUF4157)
MRAHDRRLERTAQPGRAAPQAARSVGPGTLPRLAAVQQAMSGGEGTWAVQPAEIAALLAIVGNGAATALMPAAPMPVALVPAAQPARPSIVDDVVGAPGRPLDQGIRAEMESRLDADLSAVRVHTDSAAHASAESMNAVAYTAGSHVVFQSGHYDPSSATGRRLLAHELVHVVQQRRGPVAGTDTGGGVAVSDPHDRFEREAEAVAAEAPMPLQRSPGDQAERPTSGPATGGAVVVQRKVGFEFETGWLVQQQGPIRRRWLKRKERVGGTTFNGFKIEADEDAGRTELEFIVYPPVEEGQAGLRRLNQIMTSMTITGAKLEGVAKIAKPTFPLSTVTGGSADSSYLITPTNDLLLHGGPQVTSGLDLAKIGQLKALQQGGSAAPAELQETLRSLESSAGQARRGASDEGTKISPQLQGLIAVIVNYLEAGAARLPGQRLSAVERHDVALDYPKVVGNILLARTDFAALFELLPLREASRYAERPQSFVRLVVASLDRRFGIRESDPIFARGIKVHETDPSKGIVVPDLTVGDWLYGIPHGFDFLTTVKDADSMGEFGPKTEDVGPQRTTASGTSNLARTEAGIFEFRGAQVNKLPLNRWQPFALEFLQYISDVHR